MEYIQENKNTNIQYTATVRQVASNIWDIRSNNPLHSSTPTQVSPDTGYIAMEKVTATNVLLPKKYYRQALTTNDNTSVNIPIYLTWGIGEDSSNDLRVIPTSIVDNNNSKQALINLILDQIILIKADLETGSALKTARFRDYVLSKYSGMEYTANFTVQTHTVGDNPTCVLTKLYLNYQNGQHIDEYTISCTQTSGITIRS